MSEVPAKRGSPYLGLSSTLMAAVGSLEASGVTVAFQTRMHHTQQGREMVYSLFPSLPLCVKGAVNLVLLPFLCCVYKSAICSRLVCFLYRLNHPESD